MKTKNIKRRSSDRDEHNNYEPGEPQQVGAAHGVSPMMENLFQFCGVCAVVLGIIGTVLSLIHTHRDASIWTFCAAAMVAVFGVFCWLQDKAWKADVKESSESGHSSPAASSSPTPSTPDSITPSPQPVPTPKPISPTPRHTPDSSETTLSPREVVLRIKSASFSDRREVANAFNGMKVSWELEFTSATRYEPDASQMLALFTYERNKTNEFPAIIVTCDLPTKGNERLPIMNQTDRFRVKGVIAKASEYGNIDIANGSIELIGSSNDSAPTSVAHSVSKPIPKPLTSTTGSPSPKQIIAEIDGARLLQKSAIRAYFIGAPVDWLLKIHDIDEDISDKYVLSFSDLDPLGPLVFLTVPRDGYEFLKLAERDDVFRVTGTIRKFNLEGSWNLIFLENISLICPASNR